MKQRTRTAIEYGLSLVITDDGSCTLHSETNGQTYHSESGAVSESRLVFLQNSLVQERLRTGQSTSVLEIGYGSGLNFLLTCEAAVQHGTNLRYVGVDCHWLNRRVIEKLAYNKLLGDDGQALFEQWLSWHDVEQPLDVREFGFPAGENEVVQLEFINANAAEMDLADLGQFNAVYLDAFSPQASPDLWSVRMLEELYDCLLENSRLVTYCVKSEIQRRLKSAGFRVSKTRGPISGKREVLIAEKV